MPVNVAKLERSKSLFLTEKVHRNMERRLSGSERGVAQIIYAVAALLAVILAIYVFVFEPALIITVVILAIAAGVFYIFKAHPYGLAAGVVLVVVSVIFALTSQGQGLSLAIAGSGL